MPSGFDADLDAADVARRIEFVAGQLSDLRPFWPKLVSEVFIPWMREQFASEGVFGLGHRWEPLSLEYAVRKRAEFPGKTILQAFGDLRQAASRPKRTRVDAQLLELEIPWAEQKAAKGRDADVKVEWHQRGTEGKAGPTGAVGSMPARPIVFGDPLLPGPAAMLEQTQEDYLADLVRKAALG